MVGVPLFPLVALGAINANGLAHAQTPQEGNPEAAYHPAHQAAEEEQGTELGLARVAIHQQGRQQGQAREQGGPHGARTRQLAWCGGNCRGVS